MVLQNKGRRIWVVLMDDDGDYYSKMISSVVTACYASIFGLNNLLLGDGESEFTFFL